MANFRAWSQGFLAVSLAAMLVSSAAGSSGNYLIIVQEGWANSAPLSQFASAKTAQGFDVMIHTVALGTTNTLIKDYIQSLWNTPAAPKYILLCGDTDTIPHWVGQGSRNATTDLPYVCMDGPSDWYPDIAVGRFAVQTLSQLQAVVDKSLLVESGNYSDPSYVKRAGFFATDDSTAQAPQTHDWVISNYLDPAGFESIRVYSPYQHPYGTQDVANAINTGCLLAVYFGHSSSSGWSTPAFGQSDVNALINNGLYGLVFGFSCNTAHYDLPECFGETWIRGVNKGAAAFLSASNYVWWGSVSSWESSRRMEKYFFQSMFVDGLCEVSPAWQAACYKILADPDFGPNHDHTRNIFEEFTLLGDPALRLPLRGFTLHVEPASQDLCSPPADQAQYTINVEQNVGFNEPVTLTAVHAPTGATVNFSVNSVPPPFTSILTVGNLAPSSPGAYNIDITGTAASVERTVVVGLNLSTTAPGSVTLLSPPNDAVDVSRTPTLTWQPASQAAKYDLRVAVDANFTQIVYGVTVAQASHMVSTMLDPNKTYYWHVRALNGCGNSDYSPTFSFTTLNQADYFTELFSGDPFDLDYRTVAFIPDGTGDYYRVCGGTITQLPTDPTGGEALPLGDDNFEYVFPSSPVSIYGVSYDFFYVNSNGNITFTNGDNTWDETLNVHFNRPRVSGVFDDISPNQGGSVSWKETADRVAATWLNVPQYNAGDQNTFQIELFFNGEIHISWLRVDSTDSVVGLSRGLGVPQDFLESNLSASGPCTFPGDLNCDGQLNAFDIDPFVLAITNPAGYVAAYPNCNINNADCNLDGQINAFDIDPFVDLLTGG